MSFAIPELPTPSLPSLARYASLVIASVAVVLIFLGQPAAGVIVLLSALGGFAASVWVSNALTLVPDNAFGWPMADPRSPLRKQIDWSRVRQEHFGQR